MDIYPGVDILEIERFAAAWARRPALTERLFTARERADLSERGVQSWAGRFAAKEAVLKALGTGLKGLSWQDIEILTGESGEPLVFLGPKAGALARARGGSAVRLSLSHDREKVVAFALLIP
ncbi:holo-[acyl-carrier-protein] synthase [Peptococcaceae bacterium CEB3]|nr:holo-[acyl-carrier-protein] synthase [Peptococcaceae bacterium CEB3]